MSKAFKARIKYVSGNSETTTVYAKSAAQATRMIEREVKRTGFTAQIKVKKA